MTYVLSQTLLCNYNTLDSSSSSVFFIFLKENNHYLSQYTDSAQTIVLKQWQSLDLMCHFGVIIRPNLQIWHSIQI